MPTAIFIEAPTLAAAVRLADGLREYRTTIVDDDGRWSVRLGVDREFNDLLRAAIAATEAAIGSGVMHDALLSVDERSYLLPSAAYPAKPTTAAVRRLPPQADPLPSASFS